MNQVSFSGLKSHVCLIIVVRGRFNRTCVALNDETPRIYESDVRTRQTRYNNLYAYGKFHYFVGKHGKVVRHLFYGVASANLITLLPYTVMAK